MNRRRLMKSAEGIDPVTGRGFVNGYEVVALKFPSRTILWATCNVGANEETDYGDYYKYGKGTEKYESSRHYYEGMNNPLESSVDTATQVMGNEWRMPTLEELYELINNTDYEFVTINGIKGGRFTSKTNPNAYVFFPAAGRYKDGALYDDASYGYIWSSTPVYSNNSRNMRIYSGNAQVNISNRYYGSSVRGVHRIMKQNTSEEFVDLGLPSGLLWCTHNIGGTNPEDYGYYFSWGNVDGHVKGGEYNFSLSIYGNTDGNELTEEDIPVDDTYDIARKVMGYPWRLPTKDEFKELCDNTDSEWVPNYNDTGVAGRKFMKKSDHSVYIFFPACGYYNSTSINYDGSEGEYWSSTYSEDSLYAHDMFFAKSYISNSEGGREFGRSGRAVMSK